MKPISSQLLSYESSQVVTTITNYTIVTRGSEEELQQALCYDPAYPVTVSIDASGLAFQLYSSGVYYKEDVKHLIYFV